MRLRRLLCSQRGWKFETATRANSINLPLLPISISSSLHPSSHGPINRSLSLTTLLIRCTNNIFHLLIMRESLPGISLPQFVLLTTLPPPPPPRPCSLHPPIPSVEIWFLSVLMLVMFYFIVYKIVKGATLISCPSVVSVGAEREMCGNLRILEFRFMSH